MSPHVFQRKKEKNLHRSLAQTGPCHQSQGWREDFFSPKRPREKKKTGISAHALSEYYAIDKTFFPPLYEGWSRTNYVVNDLNRTYVCVLFQSLREKKKNSGMPHPRGIGSSFENLSEAFFFLSRRF